MPPVYLLRKRALGDVLWIEPVIRSLAARHKKVIVQTYSNDLFQNYPLPNVEFKNKLSWYEKLGRNLHLPNFINLDGSYEKNPRVHVLHAYQRHAGLPETEEYPRLYLTEAEKSKYKDDGYVVLHLESTSDKNYRSVYGIDWPQIVNAIKAKGYKVFYVGRQLEEMDAWGAQFIKTSLRDLMSLLYHATFFIGVDSGPSHIAAALSIPSLLFFGAVNFDYRHFRNLFNGQFLQGPCLYAGCYHATPGLPETREGVVCRIVGNEGIPPCSLHQTTQVLQIIAQALP